MPPTLEQALAITALARCLVVGALRLLERKPKLRHGDRRSFWILPENKWLAARYGLQAECIRTPGGKKTPLKDELASLVDRLSPIAEENGDSEFLAPFRKLDAYISGAERQRNRFREAGNWQAVAEEMRLVFTQELDAIAKSLGEKKTPERKPE
jgi:carboxylate-amine ligase